jgi:hypothetical protein
MCHFLKRTTWVKLKLFCPEAKNSSPLFKFIELWGADLIEWGAISVEVNFYQSVNDIKNHPCFTSYTSKACEMWRE